MSRKDNVQVIFKKTGKTILTLKRFPLHIKYIVTQALDPCL